MRPEEARGKVTLPQLVGLALELQGPVKILRDRAWLMRQRLTLHGNEGCRGGGDFWEAAGSLDSALENLESTVSEVMDLEGYDLEELEDA